MANTNDKNPTDSNPDLTLIEQALAETRRQVAELSQKLKLARGTRESVNIDKFPKTLEQLVEHTLRQQLATLDEVARDCGAPLGKVAEALMALKKEGKVHNVGTEDRQVWTWRVGDVVPASELEACVRRLIEYQPMTLAEVVAATGARPPRASGAIVAIQRSGDQILDLGTGGRARWFLMSKAARDAKLEPKRAKSSR